MCFCFVTAAAQSQVFDISHQQESPTRTLLVAAPTAKALVLLFPGGGGMMRFTDDGSTKNRHTFIRSVNLWPQYKVDAVLVDTPYDLGDLRRRDLRGQQDHLARVGEVVRYYKNKTKLPIWIFGHSMGTSSATHFASQLNEESKLLSGVIIAGTIRTATLSGDVDIPIEAIHHAQDECFGTPISASQRIISDRPKNFISQMEIIDGGISEGKVCDSFAYHGFNQTESELVKRAAKFILSH
jgi:hypothetical protein